VAEDNATGALGRRNNRHHWNYYIHLVTDEVFINQLLTKELKPGTTLQTLPLVHIDFLLSSVLFIENLLCNDKNKIHFILISTIKI
jgi:hypothetical protein